MEKNTSKVFLEYSSRINVLKLLYTTACQVHCAVRMPLPAFCRYLLDGASKLMLWLSCFTAEQMCGFLKAKPDSTQILPPSPQHRNLNRKLRIIFPLHSQGGKMATESKPNFGKQWTKFTSFSPDHFIYSSETFWQETN